ncbi:hypothetical protein [Geodermatophilus sp. URMC 62]|uniref:hypothetical protein n=1 Tax=Geodermatophilus sp. URMC 62 TaxID=3423414 RepID=UPI00406D1982
MSHNKPNRQVHDRDSRDAHAYRLIQAERLLREAGFVQQPDGTWLPDGGSAPSTDA